MESTEITKWPYIVSNHFAGAYQHLKSSDTNQSMTDNTRLQESQKNNGLAYGP